MGHLARFLKPKGLSHDKIALLPQQIGAKKLQGVLPTIQAAHTCRISDSYRPFVKTIRCLSRIYAVFLLLVNINLTSLHVSAVSFLQQPSVINSLSVVMYRWSSLIIYLIGKT